MLSKKGMIPVYAPSISIKKINNTLERIGEVIVPGVLKQIVFIRQSSSDEYISELYHWRQNVDNLKPEDNQALDIVASLLYNWGLISFVDNNLSSEVIKDPINGKLKVLSSSDMKRWKSVSALTLWENHVKEI